MNKRSNFIKYTNSLASIKSEARHLRLFLRVKKEKNSLRDCSELKKKKKKMENKKKHTHTLARIRFIRTTK